MDVTQRRSLNGLNYSNKNIMNFFKKTLDPMIALTPIGVQDIPLFLLVGTGQTKRFLLLKQVRNKQSEHIKLNE